MRRVSGLLLVTCLTACSGQSTEEKINNAKQSLADNPRQSIVVAKSILSENPTLSDARLILAQAEFQTGNFASALKNFEQVYTESNKQNADAFEGMLKAEIMQENYTGSVAELMQTNFTTLSDQAYALGIMAALNIESDKALAEFAQKILQSESSYALLGKAYLSANANDIPRAMRLVERAITTDTANADAHLLKGMIDEKSQSFESAFEEYKTYRSMRPSDSRVLILLTRSALLNANFADADKYATDILSLSNTQPLANYAKAVVAYNKDDLKSVPEYTQYVIENERLSTPGRILAATAAFRLKNYESAYRSLQPLVGKLPQDSAANNLLLVIALKLNDQELLKSLSQNVYNADAKLSASEIYSAAALRFGQAGEDRLSGDMQKELLMVGGNNEYSSLTQGLLAKLDDDLLKTEENLAQAHKTAPDNEQITVLYVQSLFKNGKFDLANDVINSANFDSPEFKNNLAILSKLGSNDNAAAYAKAMAAIAAKQANPLTITLLVNAADTAEQIQQTANALRSNDGLRTMLVTQLINQRKGELGLEALLQGKYPTNFASGIASTLADKSMHPELISFVDSHNLFGVLSDLQKGMYLRALFATGKIEKFESVALQMVKASPSSPVAFTMLTRYYRGSRNNEALSSLLASVPEKDRSITQQEMLIQSEIVQGNINTAKAMIADIDTLSHGDVVAGLRGQIALEDKDYATAASEYKTAYSLNPTTRYAVNAINALLKSKQAKEAVQLAKNHVAYDKEDDIVKMMLATLITGTEPSEALSLYQSVDETKMKQNPIALNNYAYLLAENGELDKAKAYIDLAISLAPDNASIIDTKQTIDDKLNKP